MSNREEKKREEKRKEEKIPENFEIPGYVPMYERQAADTRQQYLEAYNRVNRFLNKTKSFFISFAKNILKTHPLLYLQNITNSLDVFDDILGDIDKYMKKIVYNSNFTDFTSDEIDIIRHEYGEEKYRAYEEERRLRAKNRNPDPNGDIDIDLSEIFENSTNIYTSLLESYLGLIHIRYELEIILEIPHVYDELVEHFYNKLDRRDALNDIMEEKRIRDIKKSYKLTDEQKRLYEAEMKRNGYYQQYNSAFLLHNPHIVSIVGEVPDIWGNEPDAIEEPIVEENEEPNVEERKIRKNSRRTVNMSSRIRCSSPARSKRKSRKRSKRKSKKKGSKRKNK